jgi:hypothetical protein
MNQYLNLVNKLYEVIIGNLTCVNTWSVYLFDSDFDNEQELRNKVGVIWLCALVDTVEAELRFLPEAIAEAESKGWESLAHNGRQLQNLCKLTSELLNLFSREEQIFLLDLRNQWTHGYFSNRHREKVSVKYVSNGLIVTEKLEHADYSELVGRFYQKGNLDQTITPIISRALMQEHRYWKCVVVLQQTNEDIYRILKNGETFNITV